MPRRPSNERPLTIVVTLTIAVVFVLDAITPIGYAVWIFYLVPSALALLAWSRPLPGIVGTTSAVLVVVGFFVSPPGMAPAFALFNRGVGVFALLVLGVVGHVFVGNRIATRRNDWLRVGQAQLTEKLQGELTAEQLGEAVLGVLVPFIGAAAGVVYAADEAAARPVATWGLRRADLREVARGEGLVGRALTDGKTLVIDKVPTAQLSLETGLGAAMTTSVVVAPSATAGRLFAVVELGTFDQVDEPTQTLLAAVAEPIAIAFRSAAYRKSLQDLLEQVQRQEEELRVTNEELQEQTAALRVTQAQLEAQQEELEVANASLEEQTSELEQAQAGLVEKAAALSQASQFKSEFLANMSHELRTPLNAQLILAKILADNARGNLDDEQVRFAQTILDSGNDLLALINDVLDISKIEAGRMDVVPAPTQLRSVVDALSRAFAPTAAQKKLRFEARVAPDVPATIETDAQKLQQILRNLLSNAVKFTEKGAVELAVSREGERVVFRVIDTGIGVSASKRDVIFEAFRQADGTTSRRFGGTGLGLSISRELARLLGGEVDVEASDPAKGSTFRLTLPTRLVVEAPRPRGASGATRAPIESAARARLTTPLPTVASVTAGAAGARTLLIVEDDPAFAEVLVGLGRKLQFQCVVASTAQQALEQAARLAPAAIILDVGLPDGTGLMVLDRLKHAPDLRHVPVHVVSASDLTEQALSMGAVGYMLKPVRQEQLVSALGALQRRSEQPVRKVLVVEDDAAQRESIRLLLAGDDLEIECVGSVHGALAALRATTFDCVITDLALEDGSGFDLLEQMAQSEAYAFPPVIVYTGRELSRDEEQRLRRYSRSVIVKGARSPERLLEEATLFLHRVEASLPPERRRQLEQARDRAQPFADRVVLVVEDDVRNLFALTSILEPRGAKVLVARNGREALARLDEHPEIDAVLMDVMMPEMDGLEATRLIRKQARFARLPVLALTAKAMPDDRAACLRAGANDYLAKPLDADAVLSMLRVWMHR